MAGPLKQFDQNEVLYKALAQFWAKGFEATSMQDLVSAMGINRASMYDSFGNKQQLFLRAFDRYCDDMLDHMQMLLKTPGSALGNLKKMLASPPQPGDDQAMYGCFINNTAVELGPHDPDIAEKIRHFWLRFEDILSDLLTQAIKQDELKSNTDTHQLARLVNTLLQGMAVKSKASVSHEEIILDVNHLLGLFESVK